MPTIDMTATGEKYNQNDESRRNDRKGSAGNLRIRNTAGHLQMEEWDGHADDR